MGSEGGSYTGLDLIAIGVAMGIDLLATAITGVVAGGEDTIADAAAIRDFDGELAEDVNGDLCGDIDADKAGDFEGEAGGIGDDFFWTRCAFLAFDTISLAFLFKISCFFSEESLLSTFLIALVIDLISLDTFFSLFGESLVTFITSSTLTFMSKRFVLEGVDTTSSFSLILSSEAVSSFSSGFEAATFFFFKTFLIGTLLASCFLILRDLFAKGCFDSES